MATARQVLTIGGISFLTAGLTYCLYFDYKRRNDPVFRRKLLKEQRRLAKKTQAQDKNATRELEKVLAAAVEAVNSEPLPTTVEGKEQFFMEQVGIGEMLASKMPRGAMPAAIAFFKAYKVYPSPQELMIIYQRTMPPEIFSIIVEMIKIDVNKVISSAKSSYRSSGPPRRPSSDGPVIEEITGDERALIDALKSSVSSAPTAVPTQPSSNVTKTSSEQESASKSNSPPTSELLTESNASKSLIADFTAENGSKAPSENGSVTAASQTANSFVLVDDDSDAHAGTSGDAPKPFILNEAPQAVSDAIVDSSSTIEKTEPPQTLEPVHLSSEVDNLNENPGKSQVPSTADASSEPNDQ